MERVNAQEARAKLAELTRRAGYGGERFVLCHRGHELAAIISVKDLALLERLEDEEDARLADEALAAYDAGQVRAYSLEEAAGELGLSPRTQSPTP